MLIHAQNATFFTLCFLGLFLFSCQNEPVQNHPNVSDLEVELKVRRFETDLFNLDMNNLETDLQQLEIQYPKFSPIYFNSILQSSGQNINKDQHYAFMKQFLNNYAIQKLNDTISILFNDFGEFEAKFEQSFKYLKYYFPEMNTPDLTTFISEFGVGVFIYDQQSLAIGLDFFIGESFPYQSIDPLNPNFSSYLTRTFNKDHLVSKTLAVLVEDLVGQPTKRRLLDKMINNGKKLYLLDHLIPFEPDSVKLEMSGQQVGWLENNELEIWAYFLEQELLYESEYMKIAKYVEASPHSPGMPPEAPGRTANWLGWQIVKAYMEKYPDTSIQALIALKDAQKILDESKYKPRR